MAGGASYEKPNQRRALEVEELKKELADIWKTIYPVGSIYMSVNSTNPSSLFGGTWVPWGSGRVPVGVNTSDGNFNFVEKTGGASTHAHTNPATGWTTLTVGGQGHNHSMGNTGNSSSLPPYITCYMWKRTA